MTYAPGPECGTGGSSPARVINSKSTLKCDKKVAGEPIPSCVPHDYIYDSVSQFTSTFLATIQKALKHVTFTVNGITFVGKTTAVSVANCGGDP